MIETISLSPSCLFLSLVIRICAQLYRRNGGYNSHYVQTIQKSVIYWLERFYFQIRRDLM